MRENYHLKVVGLRADLNHLPADRLPIVGKDPKYSRTIEVKTNMDGLTAVIRSNTIAPITRMPSSKAQNRYFSSGGPFTRFPVQMQYVLASHAQRPLLAETDQTVAWGTEFEVQPAKGYIRGTDGVNELLEGSVIGFPAELE